MLAILFDFWTSFICNVTYVALGRFQLGRAAMWNYLSQITWDQHLIVLVITLFATMSPMMVGLIRERNPEFLA